jgi:hypothetical protein
VQEQHLDLEKITKHDEVQEEALNVEKGTLKEIIKWKQEYQDA